MMRTLLILFSVLVVSMLGGVMLAQHGTFTPQAPSPSPTVTR